MHTTHTYTYLHICAHMYTYIYPQIQMHMHTYMHVTTINGKRSFIPVLDHGGSWTLKQPMKTLSLESSLTSLRWDGGYELLLCTTTSTVPHFLDSFPVYIQERWRQVTFTCFQLKKPSHWRAAPGRHITGPPDGAAAQLRTLPPRQTSLAQGQADIFRDVVLPTSLPSVISSGFSKRKCFEMQPFYW